MKRILFFLALALSMQVANAQQQVKSVAAARSGLEKAIEASKDAKKSAKVATWIKLGQSYIDAYYAAQGEGWLGATDQELQFIMSGVKPLAEEQVEVAGQPYLKRVYDTKNYYFNAAGQLAIIETTSPLADDVLGQATLAYKKAFELDLKGKKTKDIVAALATVDQKCMDEAYQAYTFGDYVKSSKYFEKAAAAYVPGSVLDTNAVYNVAFTSYLAGDYARAKEWFYKSIEIGFDGENGEAYAKLADIAEREGNEAEHLALLETAFAKYPESQSILIGLINYYVGKGENADRLFELIDEAKKNEPSNASLYYVEGNAYEKLGLGEAALSAYEMCAQVNPEYEYGYIAMGIYYYNQAVKFQEEASMEQDDEKYNYLLSRLEQSLKTAIEPFETAFNVTKNDDVRSSVAEYLKNICFRFRTQSDEYVQKYEFYSQAASVNKE